MRTTDTYNISSDDNYKAQANQIIANAAKSIGLTKSCALFLDGSHANTARALNSVGFDKRNLHCPNHIKTTADKIRSNNLCQVHDKTVGEFIASRFCRQRSRKFGVAYLDYCSTLEGSRTAGIFPKDDIECLLKFDCLSATSVFAVTVSKPKYRIERTEQKLQDFLEELFDRFHIVSSPIYYLEYRQVIWKSWILTKV